MTQLVMFPELATPEPELPPCHHAVKHQRANDLHVAYCVECGQVFYAVYQWDGTELGARHPVYFHPLPDEIEDNGLLRLFLHYLVKAGWRTNEVGLIAQYGGRASFIEAYKSSRHGVLLPF